MKPADRKRARAIAEAKDKVRKEIREGKITKTKAKSRKARVR